MEITKLTKKFAKEVSLWSYTGIYSIYNYPNWDIMEKGKWAITDQNKRDLEFKGIIDDYESLIGYFRLQDKKDHYLLSLGLKPDLCGQGIGKKVMKLIIGYYFTLYQGLPLRLEVRSFNKRALRCYLSSGFEIIDFYKKNTLIGESEFYMMEFVDTVKAHN